MNELFSATLDMLKMGLSEMRLCAGPPQSVSEVQFGESIEARCVQRVDENWKGEYIWR